MKLLGVVALVAVIVQGVLGGTRVTQVSTFLAAVHGCTGQAFFGLMVALWVLTGRDWLSATEPAVETHRLRRASLILLALVYGQIVLGAWLRHYGTLAALATHGLAAAAVAVSVPFVLAWRVERNRRDVPALVPSARLLAAGAVIQVVLGIVSLVYLLPWGGIPRPVEFYQALIRTGHQTNAALVLASSVVLALARLPHTCGLSPGTASGSPSHNGLRHQIDAGEPGGCRLKTAVSFGQPGLAAPSTAAFLEAAAGKLAAYVSLTKPRIVVMVLVTVGVGFLLGARGSAHPATLSLTLLGTGLVAAAASTLNQWMERARDARMRRTANRALPRGRVTAVEAAVFGTGLGLVGTVILLWGANGLAAAVAVSTLLLYVLVYTPLKPWTTLNTAIGAIPGALPPVIGWAAATGTLGIEAFALFLIVFLWQFPHFLAIAWIYREDYARGGMKMLPEVDPHGALTGRQATIYALALVPAGLLPATVGLAGAALLRRAPSCLVSAI